MTVTTAGGTSATSPGDQFTYVDRLRPSSSISPLGRPDSRRHHGDHHRRELSGATAVDFGSNAATITADSASSVTATSPAGSGTVDVTVTTPGGTSPTSPSDEFTYFSAPTVTSISPTSGPAAGGTSVAITGTNFTGATAVSFGGTAATSYTVNSDTSITATSPAGSGAVDVTVTTPAGTSPTSPADQFTYVAAPTVTSISPTSGPDRWRHQCDHHRDQPRRRHRGRLRIECGDASPPTRRPRSPPPPQPEPARST